MDNPIIKHRVFTYSLFFGYIVIMTGLMIWQGVGIALDRYAFLLLFFALLIGKTKSFVIDWFPFLFLWLSYDFLRGFADNIDPAKVHYWELINADKAMFWGTVPTIELQKSLFNPNHLSFLDYISTIFYFLHFALAESFAFFLWLYNKTYFREFVTAILLLSYSAWITYIFYPAAPPWLASDQGILPGVSKILTQTLSTFPERLNLPTIYTQFNPNPVAAIPSMHAAYPFLIFLFLWRIFKKKALYFLPYVLGLFFSVVYLGEHYVIDIVVGVIYAVGIFYLTQLIHQKSGTIYKILHAKVKPLRLFVAKRS